MLSVDLAFVCIFLVIAHKAKSAVLTAGNYDEEPLIIDDIEISRHEEIKPQKHQTIISDTPKKNKYNKKAIVEYGRHIYHLNNYEDIRKLRSKLKPDSISYDYVDLDELIRARDSTNDGDKDYLKKLFILSEQPLRVLYERECEEDLRKSSKKHKNNYDDTDWKGKKMQLPLGHMKRFQIVDNKHNHVRNSKFGTEHKKMKTSKKHKKKEKYSSESTESNESSSIDSDSKKSQKKKKRKQKSSEEYKPEKEDDENSASASVEKWGKHNSDSRSEEEEIPKKKSKKKKKRHHETADKTKRKTIPVEGTYFMQGNKIYHSSGKTKKKHDYLDKRRRLEHFLPKRYHWNPSEIHELGYYWFNGPRGMYPEPRPLSR